MSSTETSKEPWPWIWQRGFPLVFLKPSWNDAVVKETEPYRLGLNLFKHLYNYIQQLLWWNQVLIPWIFQWIFQAKPPFHPQTRNPRHPRCPTWSGLVSFGLVPAMASSPRDRKYGVQTRQMKTVDMHTDVSYYICIQYIYYILYIIRYY